MTKLFLLINALMLSIVPISGNSYGWGFKKNNNHITPEIGIYKNEIKDTNTYYVGDETKKEVFITFDAGYDNGNLIKILEILDAKKVEATFFITGDFLNRFSDLVVEINNRGHIVGNHTWSHKNITTLSKYELQEEIEKVENKYYELTGNIMRKYFRPPAGVFNNVSLKTINELGYTTLFWSIAYKDWENNASGNIDKSIDSVINNLHNGAIILLHTVSDNNVLALPMIIDKIRSSGYEIKSIDKIGSNYSLY